MFFVNSREELFCPECHSPLMLRDHRRRIHKKEGGKTEWLMLGRYQCTNECCGRLHNALPDFLTKYKHYDNRIIEGVIDGVITEDTLEYEIHPDGMTMMRWRNWFVKNLTAMEGQVRSAGVRLLDFAEEFLKSKESLLEELRQRIKPGWLRVLLKVIYNSGGYLEP